MLLVDCYTGCCMLSGMHMQEVERVDSALVVGLDGGSYTHGPPQLPNGQSQEEKTFVVETTFGHMGTCGQRKRMRVRSTLSQIGRYFLIIGVASLHVP
jgi:ribosomal protein S6E (S10)